MTSAQAPEYRELCLVCRRARSACWCNAVDAQDVGARLVLLQHPREARNPIGTARMAHLGWKDSILRPGVQFERDDVVNALLADPNLRHAVLWPATDARDASELVELGEHACLWVIDGTWAQARKIWNRNAWLRRLPAYRIAPAQPGQYRIRKEPAPHCLSTVESVGFLADLFSGQRELALRPFHAMVEHQLEFARTRKQRRHQRKARVARVPRPPDEVVALRELLVVVHGEGNGWPTRGVSGETPELVQWSAHRPSTGETFHALVRTNTRAPRALEWLDLREEQLVDALEPAEFARRWSEFVRPTDVLATWGWFPITLLVEAGVPAPAALDVQKLVNAHLRERISMVEEAAQRMATPPSPWLPGRGGRRLAALHGVIRALQAIGTTPTS